jgi:hypothetical protein
LRRMPPQLVRRRLQALHALPRPPARRQLIRRHIRLAEHPRLRNLLHPHQRLLLPLLLHVPAPRPLCPRRVPACPCGLQQHREARLREHVQRRPRQGLRVQLAHRQLCNAIRHVRERLVLRRDNHVQERRKPCARLAELRNSIVRAARRRAVLVVRQGSVRVDRLLGFRSAPAAAVVRVAAITRDQ